MSKCVSILGLKSADLWGKKSPNLTNKLLEGALIIMLEICPVCSKGQGIQTLSQQSLPKFT
jgi:hypothetical protein